MARQNRGRLLLGVLLATAPVGDDSPLFEEFDLKDTRAETSIGVRFHKYYFERRRQEAPPPSR